MVAPDDKCPACGLDFTGKTREAIDEHMRICTGVDPNTTTDRIDVDTLPRVERSDSSSTRKDRQG